MSLPQWSHTLLESNLEPPLTGDGALVAMLSELRTVAPQHPATISLGQVADALDGFAQQPLGAGVERYQQIESSLAGLPARSDHLFQVDLALGARASLGLDDVREIERGVHLLHALTPQHDALAVFRRAFVERYELREIPLVLALDDEVGIGYVDEESYAREPAPLLEGLGLRAPKGEARGSALPPTSALRDQLLLEKLEVAWRSGANVIDIGDDDLLRLDRASIPRLPDSLAALVSLHRLAGRMCVHLHHWAGPSAARLLGRFAAWDVGLADAVRAHLRREEAFHPDAIYAEVVHMPDASRAANVLLRPVLRGHEIAFCGRSGVADGGLVSVDDLTVSVAGERIVLRSRRLQKEIRPRLASAHNFAGRQMTIYRFLANLQQQGVAGHGHFSWGSLAGARALPRVTSGRLILAPARFALSASEISTLVKASPLERMRYVAKLRTERGLPRYLGLEDGDNVLPVDLESSLTIDALVGACAGRSAATLIELFLEESTLVGSGEGGRYTCELVVPFTRATPAEREASAPAPAPAPTIQRSYAPGSEWLYAKLYCARGSMDGILRDVVHDFVRENADRFDHWFFLRYEDPHPHLRLRFHGQPQVLASDLLPRLHRAIAYPLSTGRIEKLEVSTYVRELERYGGDHTMSLVERIFCFDSVAAVALALALEGETEGQSRWGYTLLGMHRLLDDFAFAPEVRTALVASIRSGFRAEMGGDEARLFERYRDSYRYVDGLLDGASIPLGVAQVLERRSVQVRPLVQSLRGLRRAGRCSVTSEALAASLLHMRCNRMLRTDARAHELVLHTFLWRYYESLAARARRGSAGTA
ncbi:MAG: lantibiotic dehydratase [Polyangiaceae bacterium]|nr:lantibiotic dehydratase [Polyangiaceae bacterium]